jgi:hypothetical protein
VRTLKSLEPDQTDTKALLALAGASLQCVRNRHAGTTPRAPGDDRHDRPEELPTSRNRPAQGPRGLAPHRLAGDRSPPGRVNAVRGCWGLAYEPGSCSATTESGTGHWAGSSREAVDGCRHLVATSGKSGREREGTQKDTGGQEWLDVETARR